MVLVLVMGLVLVLVLTSDRCDGGREIGREGGRDRHRPRVASATKKKIYFEITLSF